MANDVYRLKTPVASINYSSHLAPLHVNVIRVLTLVLTIESRETLPPGACVGFAAPRRAGSPRRERDRPAWLGMAWLGVVAPTISLALPGVCTRSRGIVGGAIVASPAPGETARSVELVSLTLARRESGVAVCQSPQS